MVPWWLPVDLPNILAIIDGLKTWLVPIERSFQGLSVAIETVRIYGELMEIWPNEVCNTLCISCILLIQLLHSLYTTFLWLSYDLIYVTLHCDIWHFPTLLPCIVSPKEKEKKRNINNNLVILPSHDILCYEHQVRLQLLPTMIW